MGSRRQPAFLVGLSLAALLVAACGSSAAPAGSSPSAATPDAATPAPAPTDPPASEPASEPAQGAEQPTSGRIELTDAGYALTLADNWFRVDLDDEGVQAFLDAGADELPPEFGESLTEQVRQMISNGVSLLAYRDADDAAPMGTNINVIVLPAYGMSLDTLESLNVAQIEELIANDSGVDASRVDLPTGEAVRLVYAFPTSGNEAPVGIEQYFLIGNDNQLILTCTVPGGADKIGDECHDVASSVEFLP